MSLVVLKYKYRGVCAK